jgi:hypothetical protein
LTVVIKSEWREYRPYKFYFVTILARKYLIFPLVKKIWGSLFKSVYKKATLNYTNGYLNKSMPKRQTKKTASQPAKSTKANQEVLESSNETVIASNHSEELEGNKKHLDTVETKESIYDELTNLGFSPTSNSWSWVSAVGVLIVIGVLIGGLVGIFENSLKQNNLTNYSGNSLPNHFGVGSNTSNLPNNSRPQVVYRVIIAQPAGGYSSTQLTNQPSTNLAQTGGLLENSPTVMAPADQNMFSSPTTSPVPQNGQTYKKQKPIHGQFQVVTNPDGSTKIVW